MIVIVGTGAAGTLLAARFLGAGLPTALAARTAQAARRIKRQGGLAPGRLAAVAPIDALPAASLVVLCVKSRDTLSALPAARQAAGPNGVVLSLQNGLAHAPILRRAFGARAVLGAAHFAAFLEDPGRARAAGGSDIFLGRRGPGPGHAKSVATARRLLARAGWKVHARSDEKRLLWTQLILNAAIHPLGALSRQPNGALVGNPALRELLGLAVGEAVAAARRAGARPLLNRMDLAAERLCRETSENLNPMFQDIESGRPTEADAILLPLLRAAGPRAAPILRGLHGFVRGLSRA